MAAVDAWPEMLECSTCGVAWVREARGRASILPSPAQVPALATRAYQRDGCHALTAKRCEHAEWSGSAHFLGRGRMRSRRKTCKRFNDPGHAHSLTFSCFGRQPFLSGDGARQWLVAAIRMGLDKHRYHLWAYVIMPEHVHLLVWPTQYPYCISSFLQSVKTSVARTAIAFARKTTPWLLPKMLDRQPNGRQHYRFWQRGGGYDRNITEPTTLWHEINYIHANPVRRGLCERSIDWDWSSAADYCGLRNGPLGIDFRSLPRTAAG